MMCFVALWHSLRNEQTVASWLLWEVKSMQTCTDELSAKEKLEDNVMFQLMINKCFKDGHEPHKVHQFPILGNLGHGLSDFLLCDEDVKECGTLPPCFLVTATIGEAVGSNLKAIEDSPAASTTKDVTRSPLSAGCALCGVTASADGNDLPRCQRCCVVRHCCKEHQIPH